jgi:hypothetical protein
VSSTVEPEIATLAFAVTLDGRTVQGDGRGRLVRAGRSRLGA